jgi:hypothetical protein
MMNSLALASTVLMLLAAPAVLIQPCDPATGDRVQADVRALTEAVYSGEVNRIVDHTHPTVIKLLGGPAAARQSVERVAAGMQKAGMKLESMSFPAAPTCLTGGGRRFAIVPTLNIVIVGRQRFESLNFQLGVQEPGATTWKYVEGSRVNNKNVQVLFPGFPEGFEFPQTYRKPL